MNRLHEGPDDVARDADGEALRREIEARARAEALVRDELARIDSLRAELTELEQRAGALRRAAAALAGSRLAGLLADRGGAGRRDSGRSDVERRGAGLRRRRFRLARRKRVLEASVRRPPAPHRAGPRWLARLDPAALADRGPELRRRALAELLGAAAGSAPSLRVLAGDGCPPTVSEALDALGLERASSPVDADVAIVSGPAQELAFDWLLDGERSAAVARGLAARLAEGNAAAALIEALRASARAPSFCIRIASRDWEAANAGGDVALARSLARALGERGHQALLQVDAEAGRPLDRCLDTLLVLRGRPAGEPTPGRLNLIWQISHPDETEPAELERYDRVLVASRSHAERLARSLRVPVEPLLQFTDPLVFHPVPEAPRKHAVAFVGNWRGEFRRIVWDAIRVGHPPALYGRGWDLLAPEHFVAERVPHDRLRHVYSSCDVLLCDHWPDMRRHGFVSNRVFDALACETFAIADDNAAIAAELPGVVETYGSAAELAEKLDRHLGQPQERRRMARRGRAAVLAEHTVERRVERLLEIVAVSGPRRDARGAGESAAAPAARDAGAARA